MGYQGRMLETMLDIAERLATQGVRHAHLWLPRKAYAQLALECCERGGTGADCDVSITLRSAKTDLVIKPEVDISRVWMEGESGFTLSDRGGASSRRGRRA
jgi:hypothetical protein